MAEAETCLGIFPQLRMTIMKRIRRVLYASDFSVASRRAFTAALTIAKSIDAKLTIVYVLPPLVPTMPEQYIDAVTFDQLDKQARRWSAQQLDKLSTAAKRAGVSATTVLREGDPVEQIVRTGRSTRADLIVVGTHGRRGLPKVFLGSVAERVVATAPCPVVTVRGK
jgi:nucleotide-binding universal stress UspA family protein